MLYLLSLEDLSSSKKILFLSSWYPSKVNKTLGNFVQRHAESVAVLNSVTVLYLVNSESMDNGIEIEDHIINSVRTVIVYFKTGLIKPKSYRTAFKRGIRHIGKKEIRSMDVVHHNVILNQGWQALYLKRRYNLPYVITEHWTGYHNKPEEQIVGARKLMAQMISSNASVIMPVSEHLSRAMQNFGLKGNYQIIGNVVDTKLFLPNDQKNKTFTFIHVSHLGDDHKNISGMLEVFAELINSGENLRLEIIGDGNIKPWIELRNQLGCNQNQILIEGEKLLDDVALAMGRAHAFLLFSNYENLPCVIIEAFAAGIPVISTDVGGISEMLDESRGILIEKGNKSELSSAIVELKTEYHKFDTKEIRNFALNEFSKEMISRKFDSVYNTLK